MAIDLDGVDLEEIVAWRMGRAYDAPIADWRSPCMNFEHVDGLQFALAAGVTFAEGDVRLFAPAGRQVYDPHSKPKLVDFVQDMSRTEDHRFVGLSVFVARQDARMWPSLEYWGPHPAAIAAQLSASRPVATALRNPRQQIIIWPHSYQVAPPHVAPEDRIAWDKRRPELYWRGVISGSRFDLRRSQMPRLTDLRRAAPFLSTWLEQLANGRVNDWEEHRLDYQRLRAVITYARSRDIDLKLLDWPSLASARSLEWLVRVLGPEIVDVRVPRLAYLSRRMQYRYALALDGNDEPSSIREDLLSGSCMLLPKPFFESSISFRLRAGEHYVELSADLSDLEEKMNWCREHDRECREIAERGARYAEVYLNPRLEDDVRTRTVEIIRNNTVMC